MKLSFWYPDGSIGFFYIDKTDLGNKYNYKLVRIESNQIEKLNMNNLGGIIAKKEILSLDQNLTPYQVVWIQDDQALFLLDFKLFLYNSNNHLLSQIKDLSLMDNEIITNISPDGREILTSQYIKNQNEKFIYKVTLSTGKRELLFNYKVYPSGTRVDPLAWSPDNKVLYHSWNVLQKDKHVLAIGKLNEQNSIELLGNSDPIYELYNRRGIYKAYWSPNNDKLAIITVFTPSQSSELFIVNSPN